MPGQRPGQVLQFVCLAFLAEEAATGYDIRSSIRASGLDPFVPHGQATVYSALKALETAGLVTSERRRGSGRPDQNLFRILPPGLAALKGWLPDPDDAGTIPILLRFSTLVPDSAIREAVARQLEKSMETGDPEPSLPDPKLCSWRTRASRSYRRWRVDALSELLEILDSSEDCRVRSPRL